MNSMFVPGAWWPVSTTTFAFGPRASQWAKAVPQSGTSVVERRLEELVLEDQRWSGPSRS